MRNITVSLDDETYIRARVTAAERDTSISALVKAFLEQLAGQETETERLKRLRCWKKNPVRCPSRFCRSFMFRRRGAAEPMLFPTSSIPCRLHLV